MASKVDQALFKRILQLKAIGLTDKVVSIRLGISERTVRIYTRSAREQTEPYHPEKPIVQSSDNAKATE